MGSTAPLMMVMAMMMCFVLVFSSSSLLVGLLVATRGGASSGGASGAVMGGAKAAGTCTPATGDPKRYRFLGTSAWNKGKCCEQPWSGAAGCVARSAAQPGAAPGAALPGAAGKKCTVTCPAGKALTTDCKCVQKVVTSKWYGGEGGSPMSTTCASGGFIDGINVGYDNANHELKYVTYGCSTGDSYNVGRQTPSNVGKALAGVFSMGISSAIVKQNTGYDNQTFMDPANPGWTKVHLVTNYTGSNRSGGAGNSGNRVRAFGSEANSASIFGVNNNVSFAAGTANSLPGSDIITWKCSDAGGPAPAGTQWRVNGIGASSGSAINRMQFQCALF